MSCTTCLNNALPTLNFGSCRSLCTSQQCTSWSDSLTITPQLDILTLEAIAGTCNSGTWMPVSSPSPPLTATTGQYNYYIMLVLILAFLIILAISLTPYFLD